MKYLISLLGAFAAALCLVSCEKKEAKISVFSDHIMTISQQEGISFADAAARVKAMGYDAADVWVFSTDEMIKTLDSLGFGHSCAIGLVNFFEDDWKLPFPGHEWNAQGVDVLFEDNDNLTSDVHCTADLERVFNAIPAAGHAFDTGNYLARRQAGGQRAGSAPIAVPAEPADPAPVLAKSLDDIAKSCSFILSAPFVK